MTERQKAERRWPARWLSGMRTLAALLFVLFAVLSAPAHADIIGSGTTSISLSGALARGLQRAGISIRAVRPAAKAGKLALALPIGQGSIDPVSGSGEFDQGGRLSLRGAHGTVVVRGLSVTLSSGSGFLSARVGRRRVRLFSLQGGGVTRDGFAARIDGLSLRLTKRGARALRGYLGAPGIHPGSAGSASIQESPAQVTLLAQGTATLTIDTNAAAQLVLAGVNASPIAPATSTLLPTTFYFPVTGGSLDPFLSQGGINLGGGIKQTKGSTELDLTEPEMVFDPPASFVATSRFGRAGVATIDLSNAAVSVNPSARTTSISNATLRLNAISANIINSQFGTSFNAGDPLGTISTSVTGR